ncbi:hypothetical protein ARAM_004327 [Aspergillus rambellii]|uniref:Glutamyl-tRNA synthetase n=1 Tax=Aspergillus rambellii TaxID=308745 RepID=A0A0F8UX21_9EURO|nr:hypothetical protein ARAM_004327 [Aspergillus rambellii]
MTTPFQKTLSLIDAAHAQDPKKITTPPPPSSSTATPTEIPYELHYANKMTKYLLLHTPSASDALRLAVRAQHLKRWEAELVREMCIAGGYEGDVAERVAALVRKEGLKPGSGSAGADADAETQVLEDVACLVFLDDQLEEFQGGYAEEKVLGILRKTWTKMSGRGREMALGMELGGKGAELVAKALA